MQDREIMKEGYQGNIWQHTSTVVHGKVVEKKGKAALRCNLQLIKIMLLLRIYHRSLINTCVLQPTQIKRPVCYSPYELFTLYLIYKVRHW